MRTTPNVSLVVIIAAVTAACNSPEQHLIRSTEDIRSWASGSRMVIAHWERRAVPTSYAIDALAAAADAMRDDVRAVAALSEIDTAQRDRAREAAERVRALSYELAQCVRYSDGAGAQRFSEQLADIEESLAALAASAGRR